MLCPKRETHDHTEKRKEKQNVVFCTKWQEKALEPDIGDPLVFLRLKHKSDGESKHIMNNKK